MTDTPSSQPQIPQRVRIQLAHALIEHQLAGAGVRALHHKGSAAQDGLYRPGRLSSDADVLVSPADQRRAVEVLQRRGWTLAADYDEGSIFRHAASLWHERLGYADIHRLLPGLDADPGQVFESLWARREVRPVGGLPCAVPCWDDHAVMILVHSARDPNRGAQDSAYVLDRLSREDHARLRERARALGAEAAWEIATREDMGADHAEVALLRAVGGGSPRMALLRARLHVERTWSGRARVLGSSLLINRAHLRMKLQHEPTWRDVVLEYGDRVRDVAGAARRLRRRR